MKGNREFYVYGYVRLDTNTYFYIGKGKGKRAFKQQGRSKHFLNIVNSIPCAVEIIQDNLEESEAYKLEEKMIDSLVFEEGYSINIVGFNKNKGQHLTNKYWGGTGGCSGIPKPRHVVEKLIEINKARVGSLNHSSRKVICLNTLDIFESINIASKKTGITTIHACCNYVNKYAGKGSDGVKLVWRYYEDYLKMTNEDISYAINIGQESKSKENNPFYNKKHSLETIEKLRQINLGKKQSEETKAKYDRCGEKNHMFGKRGELSPHYGKPKTEECKKKLSEAHGTKIRCIELNLTFNSLNEAEKEMKNIFNIKVNRKTIVNRMKPNSKKDWCGEVIIQGVLVKLHWEYI